MKLNLSFEEAIAELEQIIYELEHEEATLERSVELYKKGIELSDLCKKKLSKAEGEIKLLKQRAESFIEEDFINKDE